jgi:hypothetical protein
MVGPPQAIFRDPKWFPGYFVADDLPDVSRCAYTNAISFYRVKLTLFFYMDEETREKRNWMDMYREEEKKKITLMLSGTKGNRIEPQRTTSGD